MIDRTVTEKGDEETFVSQKVTSTANVDGRMIIVENVPARISSRTGERFFSPETVEQLQSIAWEKKVPFRVIETPVEPRPSTNTLPEEPAPLPTTLLTTRVRPPSRTCTQSH